MATQTKNRPLSPHLQVYRPQITSVLSILHRMTGVALAMGLFVLTYWLGAAAYGPEAFATAQELLGSWIGLLMLFGWTFCLFYHLCNGIRHLFWDVGLGLELPALRASGIAVLIVSLALTAALWAAAFSFGGTM
jgi:succinate dehydrogenase / fumarate reductase, cytochrome b subunit